MKGDSMTTSMVNACSCCPSHAFTIEACTHLWLRSGSLVYCYRCHAQQAGIVTVPTDDNGETEESYADSDWRSMA
jgi:hypothetical protein